MLKMDRWSCRCALTLGLSRPREILKKVCAIIEKIRISLLSLTKVNLRRAYTLNVSDLLVDHGSFIEVMPILTDRGTGTYTMDVVIEYT